MLDVCCLVFIVARSSLVADWCLMLAACCCMLCDVVCRWLLLVVSCCVLHADVYCCL